MFPETSLRRGDLRTDWHRYVDALVPVLTCSKGQSHAAAISGLRSMLAAMGA